MPIYQTELPGSYYEIDIPEAKWLVSALNAQHMQYRFSRIMRIVDCAYIVATDGYRLHLLRLGQVPPEFPLVELPEHEDFGCDAHFTFIDLHEVILEASKLKSKRIAISNGLDAVKLGMLGGGWEPVTHNVWPKALNRHPNIGRFIQKTRRPVAELFGISPKYLKDALSLHRESDKSIVMFSDDAKVKSVSFQPFGEHPRWRAVVAPRDLFGWVPNTKVFSPRANVMNE